MLFPEQNAQDRTLMSLAQAAAEGFRSLCVSAGGRQDVVAGAPCWYSTSSVPVFNGAAIFYEHFLNPDTLRGIGEYFTSKGRPYSLVTMDALTPSAASMLHRLGYQEYGHMPAMWLDGLPRVMNYPGNPDLWVSHVQTDRDLATFRELLATVFHIARDEAELVMGEGALDVTYVRHYLGWVGNMPVGTISLVLKGPVASIWSVGTLPQYRRRGVGTGLMHAVLHDAAMEGYKSSMLLASEEGVPLYESLGYRTLSTVRIFVPGR